MKKIILTLAVFMAISHTESKAQVNVNINIGSQPAWGPAGYDYAGFYYLPDYDIYYNVAARQWVYLNGGSWITAGVLPPRYRNINLYNTYKVVINERAPYRRAAYYRSHYAGFRGRSGQVILRDRPYRGHPGPVHHGGPAYGHHGPVNPGHGHGHPDNHGFHGNGPDHGHGHGGPGGGHGGPGHRR